MPNLLLLGLLGVGAYLLLSKPAGAAGGATGPGLPGALPYGVAPPGSVSPGDQLLAAQANAQAQAFNAQAQALGLSQAQAQEAADIGLSPQEYVDSGMGGAGNPYLGS